MAKFSGTKVQLMAGGKYAYLHCTEPGPNHNKWYEMVQFSQDRWMAYYGRQGAARPQQQEYPMEPKWQRKYNEKLGPRKRYTDVTSLRTVTQAQGKSKGGYSPISDPDVRAFMNVIQGYSGQHVERNYEVGAATVTRAMVSAAQKLIDELAGYLVISAPVGVMNTTLLKLYTTIPRKMKNVRDEMLPLDTWQGALKLRLEAEQDLLDSMAAQVAKAQDADLVQEHYTILDMLGVSAVPLQDRDADEIVRLLRNNDYYSCDYDGAIVLTDHSHVPAMAKYRDTGRQMQRLWHGSRNENWLSILRTGLLLRPANAHKSGAMFGNGLYFADNVAKSLGYTSLSGSVYGRGEDPRCLLALFDVFTGKQLTCRHMHHYALGDLTRKGYDSVWAQKGTGLRNNEMIIYREDQCAVACLVRAKSRGGRR